jgi:predicted dehydrogenase/threonine dehydrogenase-like Zn-dependent dehydrogenase
MKQLSQSVRTGRTSVIEVPVPRVGQGQVLVQVAASLISAGTERMVVDFAEKNLLQKARSRPDLVRQTLDKASREGVLTTWDAVRNRLDRPMGLGYSCSGTIIDVGAGIAEFRSGDRVACGGGEAAHAEVVTVSKNLVVKISDNVDFESAAFTTLGAVALQGVRLAEVKLGEVTAVIGLGLLGQLTVQLLKAAGCIVVGMDIQPQRAELARTFGADAVTTTSEELSQLCHQFSNGHGADAVLITADTKSNQPVELAGEIARDKGIVVAVGVVGTTIPRRIYYHKELDFRISRSYGPGRYDPEFEQKGHDYPYAYVRWTEQRNMQAFSQLMSQGKVDAQSLITHRFAIDDAPKAYALITGKTNEPFLGAVLTYPAPPTMSRKVLLHARVENNTQDVRQRFTFPVLDRVKLGVVGAGNFANAALLPGLKRVPDVELVGIASAGGLSARATGDRFGFRYCTTDMQEVLHDSEINTVALLTRHDLHARQVIAALEAGKHVFVEKPLCLSEEELDAILRIYHGIHQQGGAGTLRHPLLMVGFNRRFAPFAHELKQHLAHLHEPLILHYRVNAGYLPQDHWTQDRSQGGRLLGEACHFIDLLMYLVGSPPNEVVTRALPDAGRYSQDNLIITLKFEDGSLGTVTYVANGDKSFGKECLEVFGGGLAARLDDYRTLLIHHGQTRVKRVARLRQDKGHRAEWQALVNYLTGKGSVPMSIEDIVQSTRIILAAQRSLEYSTPLILDEEQQ